MLTEPNSKIDDTHRNKLLTVIKTLSLFIKFLILIIFKLKEFFQNIGSPVPEIEGPLYIKVESKKSWKKYYCVLRQSGLYYIPKGKNKVRFNLFTLDLLNVKCFKKLF